MNPALALQQEFADALENRGVLLSGDGKAEEAIADFDAAITLSPGDVKLRENRANTPLTLGRYSEARNEFDSALKIDLGNPALYLGRGRANPFLQNFVASIKDIKVAVHSWPFESLSCHLASHCPPPRA